MAGAMASKSKKLGFIGGIDIPLIRTFACGYLQGARYVNPKVELIQNMIGTTGAAWNDPVRGGELAGILSWTDFLRVSFGEFGNQDVRSLDAVLDHTRRLQDVMRTDVITMPISGTVRDAAAILSQGGFHSVPVVDGTRLAGIVTSSDLIHYLVEQY